MRVKEYIGQIALNYDYYPGQDLYSDGAVEDEILKIVRDNEEPEFNRIIAEKKSWPLFYHLSDLRQNVVEWLPFKGDEKVLEIGAGCGAVTGALAKKAGAVTCVELSKKRSVINAYRNREHDNIEIIVGNFEEVEKELPADFDVVTFIGVLEYGGLYIHTDTPYLDFIRAGMRHLKKGGRLVIAIENKYGLKYLAGCKEDHVSRYFAGLTGYEADDNVMTFSRDGLNRLVAEAGAAEVDFYYPYPDYKFATTVYSDKWLPKVGELTNNMRNFDKERMYLFDEKRAFDQIIMDGAFPQFSNSFLVECRKK